MRRKRSILSLLHHYFIPHKRNGYRPHVFRVASVTVILIGIIILEGAYLTQINFVFPNTNFLGAVLPSVLVSLTNEDRTENNVPAVRENDQLTRAAQDVANDMAINGYFAHVSPDGKDPWYWLNLVGYNYQYAGENLAVNFTDSSAVESAWMASPEHHANIVKPQYTQIGIGVANGMYEGKEATFVVSFFGSPADASPQKITAAIAPKVQAPAEKHVQSTSSPAAQILGTESSATTTPLAVSSVKTFFETVFTSPQGTLSKILSVLASIILILLVVAIVVKISVQFIEIIAGGLLLLLVILGLLIFNSNNIPKIQISSSPVNNGTIIK